MYDAVQSGTTADPGMGNGSGEFSLNGVIPWIVANRYIAFFLP